MCSGRDGSPGGLIAYADSEFCYGDILKWQSGESKWQIYLGPGATILMSGAGEWNYAQMALEKMSDAFNAVDPAVRLAVPRIRRIAERVLMNLYSRHSQAVVVPVFDVILAVRQQDRGTGILKSNLTAVTVSHQHTAIGSGAIIATCLADMLYRADMSLKEGALLAAFALWVANKYTQGVGGPSTILAVTDRIDVYDATGLDSAFRDLHSALQFSWSAMTRPDVSSEEMQQMLADQIAKLQKIRKAFTELSAVTEPWVITKVSN